MFGLFKRKADPRPALTIHLNARLQPMHRFEAFEDPLDQWLRKGDRGELSGGGSSFTPELGVLSCDIELRVSALDETFIAELAEHLDALGAPVGSKLVFHDSGYEMAIGASAGLALHLNGTDLPDEVYASTSADDLIEMLNQALGEDGKVLSQFNGERETSLYLYGRSQESMRAAIAPVLEAYPLCRGARLEQIA